MATECRKTKGISRYKLMKLYAYIVLLLLFLAGMAIGRMTAPVVANETNVSQHIGIVEGGMEE